ncbi:MAG: MASE1 domain-containing protein [Candidatus Kaiserbacteria bacterium]|nr:MASE1 domain-containing protein [Candidatus Kaiserbacteria bacterium]
MAYLAKSYRSLSPRARHAILLTTLFITYLGAMSLSRLFYVAPAVFPVHAGLGVAVLTVASLDLWPAIFIASVAVYLYIGVAPIAIAALAIANTAQALLAAYALKRSGFNPLLHRMKDMLLLIGVALLTSLIVPSLGILGYYVQESFGGSGVSIGWGDWWVGHVLSLVIIAPFLIRWLAKPTFSRSRRELVEGSIAFIFLILINTVIFIAGVGSVGGIPLVYVMLVPLFWVSLRLGTRASTLALVVTALFVLSGTALGTATPGDTIPIGQRLFLNEIFMEVLAFMFLVISAITEERRHAILQLEAHIKQMEIVLKKLEQEDKAKSEFIAILAHELRNPLAPVMSGIEYLSLEEGIDEGGKAVLADMERGVGKVRRLLDDLLDIARITQKKFELLRETVDLRETIARSIESTAALIAERGHTLEVSLPDGRVQIYADPLRLDQIVTNLLSNAAKYTPPGGRILLSARCEEGEVIIDVCDNGIGLPKETISQIFEPFHQIHGSGVGGLGIGLTIVKRLVEMHEGTITATSEGEGKGSCFTVRFPAER